MEKRLFVVRKLENPDFPLISGRQDEKLRNDFLLENRFFFFYTGFIKRNIYSEALENLFCEVENFFFFSGKWKYLSRGCTSFECEQIGRKHIFFIFYSVTRLNLSGKNVRV